MSRIDIGRTPSARDRQTLPPVPEDGLSHHPGEYRRRLGGLPRGPQHLIELCARRASVPGMVVVGPRRPAYHPLAFFRASPCSLHHAGMYRATIIAVTLRDLELQIVTRFIGDKPTSFEGNLRVSKPSQNISGNGFAARPKLGLVSLWVAQPIGYLGEMSITSRVVNDNKWGKFGHDGGWQVISAISLKALFSLVDVDHQSGGERRPVQRRRIPGMGAV